MTVEPIEVRASLLLSGSPARKGVPLTYDVSRAHAIEALCRAIEAHETDKKAFSDAVAGWVKADRKGADARRRASEHLTTFIIPDPEPDPLVEEIKKAAALIGQSITDVQATNITFYFAARGYKIERIEQ